MEIVKPAIVNYYSGLSGIVLPIPKYQFPPAFHDSTRLVYYSTLFDSIEINSSFYAIPRKATVEKWASTVRDPFSFSFKLFREITHRKNLEFTKADVETFMATVAGIDSRRGCLLVQFPPSLQIDYVQNLESLLITLKDVAQDSWQIALEFRHKSWYNQDVFDMLAAYGATLVIHDIPASATPLIDPWSNFIYVRFHGPTGNYRGSYTNAFLHEYAEYVKAWLREGKRVYVYFNNTAGDAFNNLVTLNQYVRENYEL